MGIILKIKHIGLPRPYFLLFLLSVITETSQKLKAELRSKQIAGVWMALKLSTKASKKASSNKGTVVEH